MYSVILPQKVKHILDILNRAGFEAYAVGGCVRDSLLGRTPGDWDITTSALPQQTKSLFHRTVDTGIAHGTVTVMMGREGFEVTTYRLDGDYSDSRHPDKVIFTPSLEEDLRRRDFTINAMAYHPEKGIVDLFGGLNDLRSGIIRAVGEPSERFDEDALRILRAVRFSAQLGFRIEEKTFAAAAHLAGRLQLISRERIQTELVKLLCSDHPDFFSLLYTGGITSVIFPLFDRMMQLPQNTPYHCMNVGEHTLAVLKASRADKVLRLAALLHDTGKVEAHTVDENGGDHFHGHNLISARVAEDFLRGLHFDNATIDLVVRLIRVHDDRFEPTEAGIRQAIHRMGEDLFPYYLDFIAMDNSAKSAFAQEEFALRHALLTENYETVKSRGDCCSLKTLAVNGSDLIAAGIKPGRDIGRLLEQMLQDVLEEPSHNTRQYLFARFLGSGAPKEFL